MHLGYNPLNSSRFYRHDDIFCRVPHISCPLEKEYLYDYTGLAVPFPFDCNLCGDIVGVPCKKQTGATLDYTGGGALPSHNYYMAAPSRWGACNRHVADLMSKWEYTSPRLPVIDEEYDEQATLVRGLLTASACSRGDIVLYEAGARWGTWGFRGLSLVRLLRPDLSASATFWEPEKMSTRALAQVAQINGFTNFTLFTDYFKTSKFLSASSNVRVIHYMDLDIQGGEKNFCADSSFIRRCADKVKLLKIGTHSTDVHERLLSCLPQRLPTFRVKTALPFNCMRFGMKVHVYTNKDLRAVRNLSLFEQSAFGPIISCDGSIVLENSKFDTVC